MAKVGLKRLGTLALAAESVSPDDASGFVSLAQEQIENRNTLRNIMADNGFKPLDTE